MQVCVPIDPCEAADFDPETVPTVSKLLTELNHNASGPLQKVLTPSTLSPIISPSGV